MMSNTPNDDPASDSQALAAMLAEDAASREGEHPEAGELVDYLGNALTPDAESRIQDHLVACRSCTRTLLDLEPLMSPGPRTAEGVADLEVAAAWRELKTRAGTAEARTRRASSQRWLAAVAASFFVATLGLSAWVAQLRGTVSELGAPQSNYEILYFESTRSLGEDVLQVPGGHTRLPVIVTGVESGAFTTYEVAVVDSSGNKIWSIAGLQPSDVGSLKLEIPVYGLRSGQYDLVLYGIDSDRREQLREFPRGFGYEQP